MPFVLRLEGQLDVEALRAAFDAIAQRHEILRTRFQNEDVEPVQVVQEACSDLQVVSVPMDDQAPGFQETLFQAVAAPFELDRGPLLRTHLWQVGEAAHILCVNLHHIVSDGWSTGILARELSTLYSAFQNGRPNPLPALPIQYRDFARWQRDYLTGPILEKLRSYWCRQLADVPPLDLPTDHPRPSVQTFAGGKVPFQLEADDVAKLRLIGRQERATLFMTLLAAFQILLQRYSRQSDFCVGTPVAGRNHPDLESLIGFFVNMLPLRVHLTGDPAFTDLLATVREQVLDAFTHADLPFENIVESLRIHRDRSRSPVFQVIFALNNLPEDSFHLPGLKTSIVDTPRIASKYDLSLLLDQEDGQIAGCFEYNPDLFNESTIRGMAAAYAELLRAVIQSPHEPISRYSLLDSANRRLQLQDWNATNHSFSNARPIASLIDEQVTRTPQAIAVSFEEINLTYQEVNEAANRVANYLIDVGIRVEDRVGVFMQRDTRDGHRFARRREGGRCLRSARPGVAGTAGGDANSVGRRSARSHTAAPARPACTHGRRVLCSGRGTLSFRRSPDDNSQGDRFGRSSFLHHVHLGHDGSSQTGREHARRIDQPPAVDATRLSDRRGGRGVAKNAFRIRRLGLGVLLALDDWSASRAGPAWRASGPRVLGQTD